jgi:hypothetical protein
MRTLGTRRVGQNKERGLNTKILTKKEQRENVLAHEKIIIILSFFFLLRESLRVFVPSW